MFPFAVREYRHPSIYGDCVSRLRLLCGAAARPELPHVQRAAASRSERKPRSVRNALQEPPDKHQCSFTTGEQLFNRSFHSNPMFSISACLIVKNLPFLLQLDLCHDQITSTIPSVETVQACAPPQVPGLIH